MTNEAHEVDETRYAMLAAGQQCQSAIRRSSTSYPKSCPNCGHTGPCRFYVDPHGESPVPLHQTTSSLLSILVWKAVMSPLPDRLSDGWRQHRSMLTNAVGALRSLQIAEAATGEGQREGAILDLAELLVGPADAP